MSDTTPAAKGSCLCGQVHYEVGEFAKPASHCHCSMCQKIHGAAFGTYGVAVDGSFRYTQGAGLVKDYASSEDYVRSFCSNCGSTLTFRPKAGGRVAVALGTVDGDPGIRADSHIFTEDLAPWYEITDTLAQSSRY